MSAAISGATLTSPRYRCAHLDYARYSSMKVDKMIASRKLSPIFDQVLRRQNWNVVPEIEKTFPTSVHPTLNAATALAICAYPQSHQLSFNGKAHRYQQALLAYIVRASQWAGQLDQLPAWVHEIKTNRMWERLATGHRCLMRSFVVRDLVYATLFDKAQNKLAGRDERSTFSASFAPDLAKLILQFPFQMTLSGYTLCGKIPEKRKGSLRSAIRRYRPALAEFEGPSPRIEGSDEELFYQNTLTRLVKPTLRAAHILQVVWEAAIRFSDESSQRGLPIDQILTRKAVWAENLAEAAASRAAMAIFEMRELGFPGCSCKLIQLGPPLDS